GPSVLPGAISRLGAAAAGACLHLLLSSVGDHGEPDAGLCAAPRGRPALAAMGLRGGRARGFCGHAACFGGVRRHDDENLQPFDGFSKLDLIGRLLSSAPSYMLHRLTLFAALVNLAGPGKWNHGFG